MTWLTNPYRFGSAPLDAAVPFANLGAEAGNMSAWTGSTWDWRTSGGGYPTATEGSNYFYAPGTLTVGETTQDYTLTADELLPVAAGVQWIRLGWRFRGDIGGSPTTADQATVGIRFLDASNATLSTLTMPLHAAPYGLWATALIDCLVPVGTKKLRLYMERGGIKLGVGDYLIDNITVDWASAPLALPAEPGFVNLGAEMGTYGWENSTSGLVAGAWPGIPPRTGLNYFVPADSATMTAYYKVAVRPSRIAAIDAGTQGISFEFYERFSGTDTGQLHLEFLDAGSSLLSSLGDAVHNGPASWVQKTFSGTVPVGTRFLRLRYHAVRVLGTTNDYYIDDIVVAYT